MIGLIVAMTRETEVIYARFGNAHKEECRGMVFYTGTLSGKETVMVKAGIGKVAAAYAAAILIERYNPDVLISTGIAGCLSGHSALSVMVVDSVVQYDCDTSDVGGEKGLFYDTDVKLCELLKKALPGAFTGRLATGDAFVASAEKGRELREDFSAAACDMEAGAVAEVAALAGIPFAALKVMSDSADDEAGMTYYELADKACLINAEAMEKFAAFL